MNYELCMNFKMPKYYRMKFKDDTLLEYGSFITPQILELPVDQEEPVQEVITAVICLPPPVEKHGLLAAAQRVTMQMGFAVNE